MEFPRDNLKTSSYFNNITHWTHLFVTYFVKDKMLYFSTNEISLFFPSLIFDTVIF